MTIRPILAAAMWAASSVLAGCGASEPVCQNEVIREALSPDGQFKASLFRRACGGPTGMSSQVSILAANEAEADRGNALIADTAGGAAPAAEWGGPDVAMEWTSARAVTLTYPIRARIIAGESSVGGVTISHRSRD
jgi:hypothetical protein